MKWIEGTARCSQRADAGAANFTKERATAAGLHHHLTKPIEFEVLQRRLELTGRPG